MFAGDPKRLTLELLRSCMSRLPKAAKKANRLLGAKASLPPGKGRQKLSGGKHPGKVVGVRRRGQPLTPYDVSLKDAELATVERAASWKDAELATVEENKASPCESIIFSIPAARERRGQQPL